MQSSPRRWLKGDKQKQPTQYKKKINNIYARKHNTIIKKKQQHQSPTTQDSFSSSSEERAIINIVFNAHLSFALERCACVVCVLLRRRDATRRGLPIHEQQYPLACTARTVYTLYTIRGMCASDAYGDVNVQRSRHHHALALLARGVMVMARQ